MKKLLLTITLCVVAICAKDTAETVSLFKQSARTASFFEDAYAYAVIPKVTKAGLLLGHAGGKGELYVQGKRSGQIKTTFQLVGPVLGMEQYSQIVFFKDQQSLETYLEEEQRFSKEDKAQPLLTKQSDETGYTNGVAVFTNKSKGLGLFYSPSLRGQKLKKIS